MTPEEKQHLEDRVIDMLKSVYDPEIPVDIYELGLDLRRGDHQ
jgi:metal-sulfur cluster biosynthetic enzyme